MDLMEYSDFCGAGDAGVDAAGCRRRRPTVRPSVRAHRRRTPEGLSPPSLPRSLALPNLKSLRHFLLLKSGAIWAGKEEADAGETRRLP